MKKFILSFGLIIAFSFYALLNSTRSQTAPTLSTPTTSTLTGTNSNSSTATNPNVTPATLPPKSTGRISDGDSGDDDSSASSHTNTSTATKPSQPTSQPATNPTTTASAPTSTGKYKNGSYTSPVVDAYYGNIQLTATVTGGALTDIQFLQYPNDRSTTVRISNQSLPVLKSEAIQAQSANVNGVSGATQTSDGFKQALSATLAQASK